MWLSLGGFHAQVENIPDKRYNTHIIINEEGNIVQEYRKLHIFDVDLTHKVDIDSLLIYLGRSNYSRE